MKLLSQFTIVILVAICLSTPAIADSKFPALRDSVNPELQKAFEKALTDHFGAEFWELAKAKKVGIAIADITDPRRPRVAAVNGDLMLYAASLPKIAILLGAFVQIERGKLVLGINAARMGMDTKVFYSFMGKTPSNLLLIRKNTANSNTKSSYHIRRGFV
ncbi:MAG: hypothetical protein WBM69_22190 [Desulfobacterales bacterium]